MIFGLFILTVALSISAVAAYYSIAGLCAIFAAAVVPIIIMGGAPGARAALASALSAVASDNIVVLVSYDASGLDAGIRSAINTGYGSTNTNTWESGRQSHIFIGIKI